MVSKRDLTAMDDPVHHIDDSLLTDASKIWGDFGPLRISTDGFDRFRSKHGHVVVRGADQDKLTNPRVYGMFSIIIFPRKNFKNYSLCLMINNLIINNSDSDNDCLNYETIGEWDDVVERGGRHMYRNWFITGAGPGGTTKKRKWRPGVASRF